MNDIGLVMNISNLGVTAKVAKTLAEAADRIKILWLHG